MHARAMASDCAHIHVGEIIGSRAELSDVTEGVVAWLPTPLQSNPGRCLRDSVVYKVSYFD